MYFLFYNIFGRDDSEKMRFFRIRGSGNVLIMEGIVYTTVFYLYNPFIQMFIRMGGGNIHTALLNALPPLAALYPDTVGILIERINRKKQTNNRACRRAQLFLLPFHSCGDPGAAK